MPIYCPDPYKEYASIMDAATALKVGCANITRVLDDPTKTVRKMHLCTNLEVFKGLLLRTYIFCYETKDAFKSVKDAENAYNITGIKRVLNKPHKTAGDYHWCTNLSIFEGAELIYLYNKIYCREPELIFRSIASASKFYNINAYHIVKALTDPNKTAGNFHWCYLTPAEYINTITSVYCYELQKWYADLQTAADDMQVTKQSIIVALNNPRKVSKNLHWCTNPVIFDNVQLIYLKYNKVICYELDESFNNMREAEIKHNLGAFSISSIVDNPNKTAGGYHWCTDRSVFDGIVLTSDGNKGVYCYELREYFSSIFDIELKYGLLWTSINQALNQIDRTAGDLHWCTDLSLFDGKELIYPNAGISNKERSITEYVVSHFSGELLNNNRSVISPLELDIYLPDLKLAIEFNGNYWHSEQYVSKNYHINKTNLCKEKGIQLIHIFEHQWDNKQSIIKSMLCNKLGLNTNKIYARKCEIKEVAAKDASNFLNENHMQGSTNSKINLGLFYEDELVSLMTFSKPRFNKTIEWELNRFCNKLNTNVVGGASKLLKYFERNYQPKSLISYANLQWSSGGIYNTLGFELSHQSEPNYWWVRGGEILSRYACQKHKLNSLLSIFDETLSETQNMKANNYNKLYDCGNLVFIKSY